MTEQEMKRCEAISAMADGQLAGVELAQTLEALRSDDAAVATWHRYHLVGDVMRGGMSLDTRRETAFIQRLRANLEQEVAAVRVHEPEVSSTERTVAALVRLGGRAERPSANDARFKWRGAAGLAVVAIAVTVGWMSGPGTRQPVGGAPALAQLPAPSASPVVVMGLAETPARQQIMMRDPKLDQWLAAHRQFGGASALQMPVGFVRNATFEGAAP
ncbi:sigma-E factor negative regulatory protein [Rhodoferax sp.]|uniref:sigma-E factor negative regulatory protein n=1 Tax=Rhodoferax sp. TaxID=50421 RepID=UPI0027694C33|nr:sigma-E factor negative regulatory protein [Rhodoferax sp.]